METIPRPWIMIPFWQARKAGDCPFRRHLLKVIGVSRAMEPMELPTVGASTIHSAEDCGPE
ncbi:hypothetical protein NKT06_09805 [Paenibacillus sp. 1781tsa1]|nr:hypothetical protein [Paenibacillus sp. 1781tsa1]MCP1183314.1 hypothetical protein [Paenibacillus sp. 1781tsa1]